MTFYERVYQTAKNRGLSIKQLAQKMGVSDATIYTWKKTGAPTGKNLTLVSKTLGVSIDYLLGNTDNPTTNKEVNDDTADLKEYFNKHKIMRYDGKPIPESDLEVIKRILESH